MKQQLAERRVNEYSWVADLRLTRGTWPNYLSSRCWAELKPFSAYAIHENTYEG